MLRELRIVQVAARLVKRCWHAVRRGYSVRQPAGLNLRIVIQASVADGE